MNTGHINYQKNKILNDDNVMSNAPTLLADISQNSHYNSAFNFTGSNIII